MKQDLSVEYLGLTLRNPLIASSSPMTASVAQLEKLDKAGIGAVVLKSVFEEQIFDEAAVLDQYSDFPEAADYLTTYIGREYLLEYIEIIKEAKRLISVPVIASINCTTGGKWIDFARKFELAGADALELNIFMLPTDSHKEATVIERNYLDIVSKVTAAVSIPVAVKLSSRFTNVLNIARGVFENRAKGVVLFNRFFEPDIDIEKLQYVMADIGSKPSILPETLRYIALVSSSIGGEFDISASGGILNGSGAVKAILAGAGSVQLCSALMRHGPEVIKEITAFMLDFMERKDFGSISAFRGILNDERTVTENSEILERAQFMKYYPRS